MKKRSHLACLTMLAVLNCAVARAGAVDLFIDPGYGSTDNTGASAVVSIAFSEIGANDYATVLFENTTPMALGSKLTAVGLELPDGLAFSVSLYGQGKGRGRGLLPGEYFDMLTFNESVSPGRLNARGGFDVMFTSDRDYRGGSANGAPGAGESRSVVLELGDTGLTMDDLENAFRTFYASQASNLAIGRFQEVGPGGTGSDNVVGSVPEPATIVLLAFGAFAIRRRRQSPRYNPITL